MSRSRPGTCLGWLLGLMLWPLVVMGHGPDHGTGRGSQPVQPPAVNAPPAASSQQAEPILPAKDHPGAVAKEPAEAAVIQGDWVQEKTGAIIPLDTVFNNEQGEKVVLRQLVDRPTLLLPIYYRCPTGCSFELANLAEAMRRSRHSPDSYRAISLSFNDEETPEAAATVKPNYIQLLPKNFPPNDWVFLTGDRDNIGKLTQSIGYSFQKKADDTYIHPSALIVLDREGRIIKYVYGSFIAGDVDLALAEALKGTPSSSIHRLLAYCFPANPRQNQQVLAYFKMGTAAMLVVGGLWFLRFLRRKKSDQPQPRP